MPDIATIPVENIRNFTIIAHIDHGKSTLADRLLEFTNTIQTSSIKNKQVLDKLKVERDRGITIKSQCATMFSVHNGITYMLNLIDTPGHIDFAAEVTKSIMAWFGDKLTKPRKFNDRRLDSRSAISNVGKLPNC